MFSLAFLLVCYVVVLLLLSLPLFISRKDFQNYFHLTVDMNHTFDILTLSAAKALIKQLNKKTKKL